MKCLTLMSLLAASLFGCTGSASSSNEADNTKEWYEGGTLHQAQIIEWQQATDANKLATCADFVAKVKNVTDLDELKIEATELVACINEATRDAGPTDNMKVSEIAALCSILLNER